MVELAIGPRVRKSPFFDRTMRGGATHYTVYNHMLLPLSYGDLLAEYEALTQRVALWDVAAERQVAIAGADAAALAQYLTPRPLAKVAVGQARYVPVCDHDGVLLSDPVLLRVADDRYWLSIADGDLLLWVKAIAAEGGFDVSVEEPDVSPLAVQGPRADDVLADLLGDDIRDLGFFRFREVVLDAIPFIMCRSGWSRQGGFELFLTDGRRGGELWDRVWAAGEPYGIAPGGPNPIERLESGLLSFGSDTDADTDPFEAGLGRYVKLDGVHDFIGKAAVERAAAGLRRALVIVEIAGEMVPFNEHPLPVEVGGDRIGELRNMAWSPRQQRNIGLAMIDAPHHEPGTTVTVRLEDGPRRVVTEPLPT